MPLIDLFLKWWLRWGRYPWSRCRRRLLERRYASLSLPTVSTLDEIRSELEKVTWTMDGPLHLYDAISYPGRVWAKKRDDCDGFAVLAAALLTSWEASSDPCLVTVMLRPVRKSHTVCAFKDREALKFFDNARLDNGVYETHSQLAENVSKGRRGRLVCWDIVDPATLKLREFHGVSGQPAIE